MAFDRIAVRCLLSAAAAAATAAIVVLVASSRAQFLSYTGV